MNLDASTAWWLATGVLVAVELASGTFYLLMLAIGTAAAALAAHAGLGNVGQLVAAAAIGGGAVALWHQRRRQRPPQADAASNRDLHLDIGSTVHVTHWHADGTARVHYRGASWDARHAGAGTPQPGEFVVRAVEGNRLVLERHAH
jgi:membrane protein implicated in regulation of membrane protease activity